MRDHHHARFWLSSISSAALLGFICLGCSKHSALPTAPGSHGEVNDTGISAPLDDQDGYASDCPPPTLIEPANFTHSTQIDNQWLPLVPGWQYTFEGTADRGGGDLSHIVVFTVTDLVKEIDGVNTVVMWDRDYNDGVIVEAELAFFAQDNDGNVWNLGEYPEEYEYGKFIGAPNTWISGQENAQGGIMVQGKPKRGNRYLQGYAPEIDFLDCAEVLRGGRRTCVPTGCYENVWVVEERSPLEPLSGSQLKYYAPGVGNVRIASVNDPEGETLVLLQAKRLSEKHLARARLYALKLEENAYQVSDAYRQTPRAH
jgi:hypothetical protein